MGIGVEPAVASRTLCFVTAVFDATFSALTLAADLEGTFFDAGAARNVLLGALGVSFLRLVELDDGAAS